MKKTLFLLTIIICSVGSIISMDLNQFFNNKNVLIQIGNITNNRDEDLLFSHGEDNFITVPANDSVNWGYSLLPLQQRGLSRSVNQKNWGLENPIAITTLNGSVTGSFGTLITVIDDQTIKLKASFNLENDEHQNVSSPLYEVKAHEITCNKMYVMDLVVGDNQNESQISIRSFSVASPR